MKLSRRSFLHRGSLATVALAGGSGLSSASSLAGESTGLGRIRQIVASYASNVTVQADSREALTLVCEIADLGKFADSMACLVPADAPTRADGNILYFQQSGRQVQIEHVWKS